ncbi:MAG: 2-C-methyl-D-erythritol 4-phosphate cytidylyltransferase [Verrucomicrobiales bacterium]|nr:2-C-methyl-D-erythritol 4-phosphate cytidylyltransferase [Verrucomicrobiales bacterium]
MVAGGLSSRMGFDKILAKIGDSTVIEYTINAFLECISVNEVIIVINEKSIQKIKDLISDTNTGDKIRICTGGKSRRDSVANGLEHVGKESGYVAVHDGARPWIRPAQIEKVFETAIKYGAAASARPITDTVKRCDPEGTIIASISKKSLWAMETPQIFKTELLKRAYKQAIIDDHLVTDEVSALELIGEPVRVVHDSLKNPKVTFPDDLNAQDFTH